MGPDSSLDYSENALLMPDDIRQPSVVPEVSSNETPSLREDLMVLTKARLSGLVLVTTLVGYLLAAHGHFNWILLLHVMIGTGMVTAASAVFNQIMERDCDAKMVRTRIRPLPAGRMRMETALLIGSVLALAGLAELYFFVNFLSFALTAATLFLYIAIYTPMKRMSTWCTLVGAVAGAVPPMIGWTGVTDQLTEAAWILFGILFFWQLPHFLAINWMYKDEYKRAGFVMWSNDDASGAGTAVRAIVFTIGLLAVTIWPAFSGGGDYFSGEPLVAKWFLIPAVLLGGGMLALAIRFLRVRTVPAARALFFYTLAYLPALLGSMLIAAK